MSDKSQRVFLREIEIEWGDCDPAGIVYYPRYFEMFDTATAHMIASATHMSKFDLLRSHEAVGFPMVSTGADFRRPSRFGDKVKIESSVTAVGRTSFEVKHRLLNGGELAIEAFEKRVWVQRDAQGAIKATPLPPMVVAALSDARLSAPN